MDADTGFAEVYDIIYAEPRAFLEAQIGFLLACFAGAEGLLLDAGCGTGRHVMELAARGREVAGVDASWQMLTAGRARLAAAGQPAKLVHGDLRSLPVAAQSCSGILCLESPLAYLLTDEDLACAAQGLGRALRPGGRLVVDVFDYPGTLGPDGIDPQTHVYPSPWGSVAVTESHGCDPAAGEWRMRQVFTVIRAGRRESFTVVHTLSLRPADEYAAALEEAGFAIRDLLTRYPDSPPELAAEQRMIFIADKT